MRELLASCDGAVRVHVARGQGSMSVVVVATTTLLNQDEWKHDGKHHHNQSDAANNTPLDVLLASILRRLICGSVRLIERQRPTSIDDIFRLDMTRIVVFFVLA